MGYRNQRNAAGNHLTDSGFDQGQLDEVIRRSKRPSSRFSEALLGEFATIINASLSDVKSFVAALERNCDGSTDDELIRHARLLAPQYIANFNAEFVEDAFLNMIGQ